MLFTTATRLLASSDWADWLPPNRMAPSRPARSGSPTTRPWKPSDIGGRDMAASQKFRNAATTAGPRFVVDDIASVQPWRVRCLEIRGHAEVLTRSDGLRGRLPGPDHPHPLPAHHQLGNRPAAPEPRQAQRRSAGDDAT